MEGKTISISKRSSYPYTVVQEPLGKAGATLTNFFFRFGANVYVFSYEKNGKKRHTFIDSGYAVHRKKVFAALQKNGIDLKKIENIIITHRHPDHSGLAEALAVESGATIVAHQNFRQFVEGDMSAAEKRWMGEFDPAGLKKCNMEYLDCDAGKGALSISGVDFPRPGRFIEIGDHLGLEILACPPGNPTHSPDQLMILFSPGKFPYVHGKPEGGYRPTDEMIFAGDLWLMRGPIFEKSLRNFRLRMGFLYYRLMARGRRADEIRRLPMEQDAKSKDALKRGFPLIRVKPGHGDEFLGSSLIPKSLLADRDLLIKLGYSLNEDKSVLNSEAIALTVSGLREQAYRQFSESLMDWQGMGYSPDEISGLLFRIYTEQNGGGPLVEEDRKERRGRLKELLNRLMAERSASDILYRIAESTLPRLDLKA
jgi:glyoxylase-like metal-dependent hydrolase (beta-lactamase superfamily II)